MNFGIPYMGSKSGIAKIICKALPPATRFYDLFGGGFAITHCMMVTYPTKYKEMYFNEIRHDTVELIRNAIEGKYSYETFKPEWISREEFERRKDRCAYTRIIWSFGNNQKSYLFGKDIEEQKKSLHQAVVFNEFDSTAVRLLGKKRFSERSTITQRRLAVRNIVKRQQLQQLEQLERLQQLQQLERLERLQFSSKSYDHVEIKPESIIYCDPPYQGTADYEIQFDHSKFWEWVERQDNPVFVSEYRAPKQFDIVLVVEKKTKMSQKGMISTDHEKVFCNAAAKKILTSMGRKTFANNG